MIDLIELVDFQDSVMCKSLLYQSKESFLKINCRFCKGNVYGLISDFGCGSWGVTACLAGRSSANYKGEVLLNGKEVLPHELQRYSCFVSEITFLNGNLNLDSLTPKECIEKAISLSKQPYSVEQIKKIFCLSDGRFERPIDKISGEVWLVSMAVNFALGKEIFCYPWLNMMDIVRFEIAKEQGIIDFLKNKNKLIFVPSSQKKILRKQCDHTLTFEKGKTVFR